MSTLPKPNIIFLATQPYFNYQIIQHLIENNYIVSSITTDKIAIYNIVLTIKPDFIVVYGEEGLDLIKQIKTDISVHTRCILVLSSIEDPHILHSLCILADGYIFDTNPISFDDYHNCLKIIKKGERYFSPKIIERFFRKPNQVDAQKFLSRLGSREKEILKYIGYSYPIKQIADLLCLSPNTIQAHRSNLIRKLELNNAKELRQLAIKMTYSLQTS